MRGVGAGWVYLSHLVQNPSVVAALGLGGAALIVNDGWLGVALFLTLSIYLLVGKTGDLRHYFRRRMVRIWPAYFIAFVVTWYLIYGRSWSILIGGVTFSAFWLGTPAGYMYPFWTLQLEEVVYLIIPLIALLSPTRQRWLSLGMIVGGEAFGIALIGHAVTWWSPLTLPVWLGVYGAGLLAYTTPLPRLGMFLPVVFVPAILPWIPWCVSLVPLALVFASMLKNPPHFLTHSPLVILGELSYSIYLTQAVLLALFGVWSLLLILPVSFGLELLVRRGELTKRLAGILKKSMSVSMKEKHRSLPEVTG